MKIQIYLLGCQPDGFLLQTEEASRTRQYRWSRNSWGFTVKLAPCHPPFVTGDPCLPCPPFAAGWGPCHPCLPSPSGLPFNRPFPGETNQQKRKNNQSVRKQKEFNLLNHLQSCLATAVGLLAELLERATLKPLPLALGQLRGIRQGHLRQLPLLPQVVAQALPLGPQVLQLVEPQPPVRLGPRLQVGHSL